MSTNNANHDIKTTTPTISTIQEMHGAKGFQQVVAQSRHSAAVMRGDAQAAEVTGDYVKKLRANAQLRKDEWKSLDDTLLRIAQDELNIVDALRSRGLTVNEDLSTLIREFEKRDEFSGADVDMEPETAASEDTFNFTIDGVPLPIVHKGFHIPYRKLLASRERGQDLSAQSQEAATRVVAEKLEDMVWNGHSTQLGGYDIPGMTTEANRNTFTSTNDWDDTSGTTADQIRGDILSGIETLENDNYRGPYLLYMDRASFQALRRRDTGTDQERGLLERIREEFGGELDAIEPADYLDSGEYVMFQPSSDVVELAVAADMQNVEWSTGAGFRTYMKVFASITPIVKSDQANQSGIVHADGLLT